MNLFEAARATCPYAIAAIRLLVLTGCRSAEILKLRWEEVDFERRCLHLPDSKTGKRTILLNGPAIEILEGLEPAEGNPWVVPGEKPGTRRRSLQAIWERIRKEAELPDVRIHDIRHTYASFGVNGGQNLAVVGRLLGHSKITTTQRYAHLADDSIRRAGDAIGSDLANAMTAGDAF
ncbi:MAG: site-specific integrase [Acidobacteriota bacterium]